MFENAAIIGVGQSAYTRRPEPGQTALHFMRDAVVAALTDAGLDAKDIQGMAVASFSLAPDAAVDLAWKLGLLGACVALYTFMADTLAVVAGGVEAVRTVLPVQFNWPLFAIALALLAMPTIDMGWQLWRRSKPAESHSEPSPAARHLTSPPSVAS